MDISGLSGSSAGSFTGYGGVSSLPAITQAKIMVQSQSLSLLPAASGPDLGGLGSIYDAVGKQALGALSGLSGLEITQLSMGIGDGQTTSALSSGSSPFPAAPPPAPSSDGSSASGTSSPVKDPVIGSTLNQILKEDGYVAPETNPYVYNKDYFSDPGSLGGLLNTSA